MCPEINWRVENETGAETVIKTSPRAISWQRKALLGIVILLGASLGVIYNSISKPALSPTATNITLRPTLTHQAVLNSSFTRTPTFQPTRTHMPTRWYLPAATSTLTLSPSPTLVIPALQAVSTTSKSSLRSCSASSGSAWRSWRSEPYPYAVRTLLLDQGKLWAGTASGLFEVNPRTNRYAQTLPYETTGGISMLLPLGDGRLWAESDRGHFYYDGRQWFQVRISRLNTNYLHEAPVFELAIDQNDDLWIYYETRDSRWPNLYHLPGFIPPNDRPWTATLEKPFWKGSDRGPWQVFTDGLFSYRSTAECEAQNQTITSIVPYPSTAYYIPEKFSNATDRDGSVWWTSIEFPHYILNHASDGRLITSTLPVNPRGYDFTYPLAPDPVRGVWRGDSQGLIYTDGKNTRRIDFAYDPCTVLWPNDLAIDARGTIWIGSPGGQILKKTSAETNWAAITLPDLPQSNAGQPITAIAIAPNGSLWATHGYDLFNVNGTPLVRTTLPDPSCALLHLIATNNTISGWGDCGLWQFDIDEQTWISPSIGPYRAKVVVMDSNNTIYAGGSHGLYTMAEGQWRQVAPVPVTAAAADRHGGLWLASREQGTLWYFRAGQLTSFGQPFDPNGLWYLLVDNQDHLWAAYSDRLLRYASGKWQTISSPVRDIDRIAVDLAGRIWLTGRHSTSGLSDAAIAVYDPARDP